MKRIIILFLFLSATINISTSHAQQGRLIVSPMQIVDITSFGYDTIVAVGGYLLNPVSGWPNSSGFIARSTDGGTTWQMIYRENSNAQLHKIISVNDSVGFAVADSGLMYRTVDAGFTWIRVDLNTGIHLYNIEFTDSLTGYATGSQEDYLKTTDGGSTWTSYSVGGSFNGLYDIHWVTDSIGYLSGEKSYRTTNGGNSWTTSGSPYFGYRLKQHWKNDLEGWVGTFGSASGKSVDGGMSWTLDSTVNFVDFHQFSSSHFIGVKDTMVFQTTDSGTTWNQISTFPQGFDATSIHFTDMLTGYAGGTNKIYKTTDGGINWSATGYDHDFQITHVFAFDSLNIYTVNVANSPIPTCHYTLNGGATWNLRLIQGLPAISDIEFLNAATGFIASAAGLYLTTDSGSTWNLVNPFPLSQIHCFDQNHLFAYDNTNNFVTSTNGGTSWSPALGSSTYPRLVKVNAQIGFASVSNSLYRTVDGGNTWNNVNSTGVYPRFWHMADGMNGVARNHNTDDIFTTADGGSTWTYRSTEINVNQLLMIDPASVSMISTFGSFTSVDSGVTFTPDSFFFYPAMDQIVQTSTGDLIYFGKFLAINPGSGFPLCKVSAGYSTFESDIFESDQFNIQNESANATQFEWSINGAVVSSSLNYSFYGNNVGNYDICLKASTTPACYEEKCESVEVVPLESEWLLRIPAAVSVRMNRATFVIGNTLYECTGGSGNGSNQHSAMDLVTFTGQPAASLPGAPRHSAVGFAINGKGYIGLGMNGNNYLKDLWQYDPVTNSWVQKATFPGLGSRGCSAVVINGKAYVINGSSFDGAAITYYSECWEYDPVNDSWLQRSSFPGAGRIYTLATAANNLLVCGGGNRSNPSVTYNDYYQYDPSSNQWTSIPAIPANAARTNGQTFSRGNKAYFIGGYFPSNNQTTVYGYDVVSQNWDSLPAAIPDILIDAYCVTRGDSVLSCFPYYAATSHNRIHYLKFAPLPVGIDETNGQNIFEPFLIYPNPTQGSITIRNVSKNRIKRISVFSTDNKWIQSYDDLPNDQITIHIPVDGVYFMKIECDSFVISKKVVVIR